MENVTKWGLIGLKVLLTLVFAAAGFAKLAGQEMMIASFDTLGLGQWFRYVTGVIEVGAAALLWVPGRQWLGAGLLVCTMVGAVLAHLLILGPSLVPALILGILAAIVLFAYRAQLPMGGANS